MNTPSYSSEMLEVENHHENAYLFKETTKGKNYPIEWVLNEGCITI